MSVYKVNEVFSDLELEILYELINSIVIPINQDGSYIYETGSNEEICTVSSSLGRLQASFMTPPIICDKIFSIGQSIFTQDLVVSGMTYVEYNKKYGTPNLPPHFDGDASSFIVNYQLSSNTDWDIGVDLKKYNMEDNSALIFDPNKNIHWRTHKEFEDNEYVKMIFFRLQIKGQLPDNSSLRYSLDHEAYKKVNEFRDSLISNHL